MRRYEFFFDVIQQSIPDVAIVCLDADQAKAIQLIAQVSQEHPELPLLAVCGATTARPFFRPCATGPRVSDLARACWRNC